MIKLDRMKGFTYKKFGNYQEITNYLTESGLDVHELGLSSGSNMVYGLSIGDLSKPMFVVDGTMHGNHEWRCTHWVTEFGKRILDPVKDSNLQMIEELKVDYCFMFVPCLNTYGYLHNNYQNANGVNLNRNFPDGWENYNVQGSDVPGSSQYKGTAPLSEPESQIMANLFKTYKVVGHVNTHTSGGYYGYTIENASGMQDNHKIIVDDFFDSMKLNFIGMKPWNESQTGQYGPITHRTILSTPWITEYASRLDSKVGGKIFSVIFETGSLETLVMGAEIGMTGLLMFFKHIADYRKSGNLVS